MSETSRPCRQKPRILAADLDGTLIPLQDIPQNLEDLRTLREHFAVARTTLTFVTGRHLTIVREAIHEHQLPQPDWIICDVGTTIYQRKSRQWRRVLPYTEHLAAISAALPMSELRRRLSALPGLVLQEEHKQARFKLSFYVEHGQLEGRAAMIADWLRDHRAPYSMIRSIDPFTGEGLIDVLPRGVSKAYAIEWWRRHLGFGRREIVFAGDSGNDQAALTAGYRAIVVANADRQLVQEVASHHAERGWTDRLHLAEAPATSGVLEGCRRFGLID